MAGASKFGGTENGADCSKCGGTVAVLFKTRNGTSLVTCNCACKLSSCGFGLKSFMVAAFIDGHPAHGAAGDQ